MLRSFLLFISLGLLIFSAHAQEIYAQSDTLHLDFGYPIISVVDDLRFTDENDNNNIDPGESSIISFTIKNTGNYLAKGVSIRPQELNNLSGLMLPDEVKIGDIKPGEDKLIQVGIVSGENLEKGTASLIFYIHENGRYDDISIVYAVGTSTKKK
ncbi:MAG: hypothetical protein SF052_13835 [Bacteroidia bacterium]|nr:hypothetical protein [Bacteroidia bacterium]